MHFSRTPLFLTFLSFIVFNSSAFAFTLNGSSYIKGWESSDIAFNTNFHGCTSMEDSLTVALNRAFDLWNGVTSADLKLSRGGDSTTSATRASQTGAKNSVSDSPLMICDTALSSTLNSIGAGSESNNIPGVTKIEVDSGNLHVYYAAIFLNAESGKSANISNLSENSLAVVIAHEMGHALGLGHTSDKTALMYFDTTNKKNLALSRDDSEGATYLYPRGEIPTQFFGCGSIFDSKKNGPFNRDDHKTCRHFLRNEAPPTSEDFSDLALKLGLLLFGLVVLYRALIPDTLPALSKPSRKPVSTKSSFVGDSA